MKKLAAAFNGKAAAMIKPADAQRTSGYIIRGISPFGQNRQVPTVVEADALAHPLVFINGGQRGLQIKIDPRLALKAVDATAAAVKA